MSWKHDSSQESCGFKVDKGNWKLLKVTEVLIEFPVSVQNVKMPEFSVHVLYNSFATWENKYEEKEQGWVLLRGNIVEFF